MENIVEVEIEKNKFLAMEESKAIEFAVQEYFGNNRIVKTGKLISAFTL